LLASGTPAPQPPAKTADPSRDADRHSQEVARPQKHLQSVTGRRQRLSLAKSTLRKLATTLWHSSCWRESSVDASLARHLDACRQLGLMVDEDFEVGIRPRVRVMRTIGLAFCVVALALVCAALLRPERFAGVVRPAPMRSASPTGAPRPSGAVQQRLRHHRTIRGAV
jgi:hypothetical protein